MSSIERKRKQQSDFSEAPQSKKPSPPKGPLLEKPFPRQSLAPETRASDDALSYHSSLVEVVASKSLLNKPFLSTSKISDSSALPKTAAANAQAFEDRLLNNLYVFNAEISELFAL